MTRYRVAVAVLALLAMSACGGGSGTSVNTGPPGAVQWESVTTPSNAAQINFVDFAPNGHWFIADRAQGFYRSTDQGATWTQINSGLATTYGWTINVIPNTGDLIASIFSSGGMNLHPVTFYRSTDEGNSWTAMSSVSLSSATALTGCAFAANNNIVCGGFWAPSPASGVWVSTDGGQTTTASTTTTTNGDTAFAFALNPVSKDLWLGTEQNGIFRSTDNGFTWSAASPGDTNVDPVHGIRDGNVYAITFDRNGNVLFGSQGGIWKSSKSGTGFTWASIVGNGNTSDVKALARDANGMLYYGHHRDTANPADVYCSRDDGTSWAACDSGLPQLLEVRRFAISASDGRLYAVTQDEPANHGQLFRTVNPVQ